MARLNNRHSQEIDDSKVWARWFKFYHLQNVIIKYSYVFYFDKIITRMKKIFEIIEEIFNRLQLA